MIKLFENVIFIELKKFAKNFLNSNLIINVKTKSNIMIDEITLNDETSTTKITTKIKFSTIKTLIATMITYIVTQTNISFLN